VIDELSTFHLLRPWSLSLLAPALVLWWLQHRQSDAIKRWESVIDPVLLSQLTVGSGRTRRITPVDLLLAAWIVGIIAMAGPTWRQEPSPFAGSQPPAMILLRVNQTMTTGDLQPSRLERARQKIADLLELREGAATGLIAYSGSAHLVLPPTPDRDVVLSMAQALAPEIMPSEGDRLADAVKLAAGVLSDGRQGGSIVILADTVATGQIDELRDINANGPPISILAMVPPDRVDADPSLSQVSTVLDASLDKVTVDRGDVTTMARRLARQGQPADVVGEGTRWQEAGYWLTPLIALIVLGWFRRGWVLAG
jgi:Ca-activated chloride channel family protein